MNYALPVTSPPDDDVIVWGAANIGREIGRSAASAYYLLSHGHLPSRKVGGRYCVPRSKLKAYLAGDNG